jgi:hypothetical protein
VKLKNTSVSLFILFSIASIDFKNLKE